MARGPFGRAAAVPVLAKSLGGGRSAMKTAAGGGIAVKVVTQADDWVHWRAPFLTAVIVAGIALALLLAGPKEGVRKLPPRAATTPGEINVERTSSCSCRNPSVMARTACLAAQ